MGALEPGKLAAGVAAAAPRPRRHRRPGGRRGRLVRRLAAPTLALALAAAPAAPQGAEDREADLERIRDEIAALEARRLRLRDRWRGLTGELRKTELDLEIQARRVEESRAERALAEARLAATEVRVAALEVELAASRGALRERLADLYRLGRGGSLRLLMAIRTDRQLLPGVRMLRYLARREAEVVERVLDARVRLGFERDQRRAHGLEIAEALRREDARWTRLEALRRRQSALIADLEGEAESVEARTERLIEKERKLANLVDLLYGRHPQPLAGTPIGRFRGVLDWPAQGPIVEGFGPRLDPRYRTRVPHNGVDIATRAGQEVRVVFPGEVLFAAPFQGFGLTAIVHHPGRVFTLYAGLEALRVGQGDVVALGDVVGAAGERLYFEIRVENRPEDPTTWLR